MIHSASTFYSNFSMAKLVKRNSCWPLFESSLGGLGGGGGGHFSGVGNQGSSRLHKTDSFAVQLKPGGLAKGDEEAFLSALKADLRDEILKSGAGVTASGDLQAQGCYVDYSEEGIQGRIEISRRLSGRDFYTLTATLSETSTKGNSEWIKQIKRPQPTGTYYVVPARPDGLRASNDDLLSLGQKLIQRSVERMGRQLRDDHSSKDLLLQKLEYAEVYVWQRMAPEHLERFKEVLGPEFRVPAKYGEFEKVYFLNEVALKMYREAEADFLVHQKISGDQVPGGLGPALRGPYFPPE